MTKEQNDFEEVTIQVLFERIKKEIALESVGLKEIDFLTKCYSKWYGVFMSIYRFLIRVHKKFSSHNIYMKSFGAMVLYLRAKNSAFQVVRFSDFLLLKDEAFIATLYKVVLKREVDLQSFSSMMAALQSSADSRVDIGYDLNLSAEASLTKVYIRGVYGKKVRLDFKRDFHRWFNKPATFLIRLKNRLLRIVRGNKI